MIELQFPPSVWILIVSAAVSATLSYLVWQRRPGKAIVPFVVMMASVTIWSLGNAFEQIVVELDYKLIFTRTNYILITIVPASWLLFAAEYTGHTTWVTQRNVRLLMIEPVLVQIAIWTNPLHDQFFTHLGTLSSGGYVLIDTTFGSLFWLHAVYSYIVILAGALLFFQAMARAPQLYRGQMTLILVAIFAPWLANAIYIFGLSPIEGIDLTPLAFTVTGAAMAWNMRRYQLFDVVPVARDLVVESMNDIVLVLDVQNRIVDINPAGRKLLNVPGRSGVIGKRPSEVLPQYEQIFDQFREVEEAHTEIALGTPEEPRHFELHLSPIRSRQGELTGRVAFLHEITNRRKAAEQIRAQNEELRFTNRALELARNEAIEANRLKSEFLATISHELRTPLNSIIGFSDLLLTGLAGELNEKQTDYVQRGLSNGERLLALINELLDLSKIEAGRFELHPAPYNVEELMRRIQAQMQGLADQKQLAFNATLDPQLPKMFNGDVKRIEQIIVNLVGNAIKYTETGEVSLGITRHATDTDQWSIVVSDTGIGIPPHAVEFIFDEFRQVDSSPRREYQGTGLGLTIVQRLTQLMKGTIEIESEVGKGSTFTIHLPLVVPEAAPIAETAGK